MAFYPGDTYVVHILETPEIPEYVSGIHGSVSTTVDTRTGKNRERPTAIDNADAKRAVKRPKGQRSNQERNERRTGQISIRSPTKQDEAGKKSVDPDDVHR